MSELVLLGTGSADGWPNPFCGCASCLSAAARGEVRGQSAALLDGTVMLDCGPEAPRAAVRAGTSLVGVRLVLLTHSHPDHTSPAPLLWRSWTRTGQPLLVVGPDDAVQAYEPWLGPEDPVTLRPVVAGDEVVAEGYRCRAVAGTHEVPTVLWDVTCPDGTSLLYATDTGPLSSDALEQVRGRGYDLLVLEETFGDLTTHGTAHHDLVSFPAQLAELRRVGAVTGRTRVLATHLSHHNPPTDELAARLAAWGAEVRPDGTRVRLGDAVAAATGPGTRPGPDPYRPRRTLVLGGARSGKSTHAERLLADRDDVVYVATAGSRDGDADWQARVALHRRRRPEGWRTVESTELVTLLEQDGPPLLVDCLALWCTDALDRAGAWEPDRWHDGDAEQVYRERVADLLGAWGSTPRQVVAVSNEVGSGVVPATWSGRLFRDELGRLNAAVASASERVELVVAGTVQRLR
ncbi:bifunctional adenosylcobinamide kinase/adenosylcobinamide-phosphate guanylyltransferase [Aquipuribacter sp. MA13-6]|uniref:bifunctional adenosylcobinamide kinase/adenosylcobinamide-phosphate guanylyltransferase n=1 Tax=unclassified Aquipuribacter TaxID=2635084 RepID=UPI003EEDB49F